MNTGAGASIYEILEIYRIFSTGVPILVYFSRADSDVTQP